MSGLSPSLPQAALSGPALQSVAHQNNDNSFSLNDTAQKSVQHLQDLGNQALDKASQLVADIPEPAAQIARPVAIAGAAGIGVATVMALPAVAAGVAAIGLGTAGTIALSSALGAGIGVVTGQVINRVDEAVHDRIGETGNFEDTSMLGDALYGGGIGAHVGTMSWLHPSIERIAGGAVANLPAFLAKSSVAPFFGKSLDLGIHSSLHIGLDMALESVNQTVQSLQKGATPQETAFNVKAGLAGTPVPSVISSLLTEYFEQKFNGSRPFFMAAFEGAEAAFRSGSVKFVKNQTSDNIQMANAADTPQSGIITLPPAYAEVRPTLIEASAQDTIYQMAPAVLSKPHERTISPELQEQADHVLAETKRFDTIYNIVTERNRIDPDGSNGRALASAYKNMKEQEQCLALSLVTRSETQAKSCLNGAEQAINQQAAIYNQPGYR